MANQLIAVASNTETTIRILLAQAPLKAPKRKMANANTTATIDAVLLNSGQNK